MKVAMLDQAREVAADLATEVSPVMRDLTL
jgi:hypothetical protein